MLTTPAPAKRAFDLLVAIATAVVWIPAIIVCGLAILLMDGRPIFYVSQRRTGPSTRRVVKFRTMRRDAEFICNRDSVPVSNNIRFLNTPSDSPLYTRIGRIIEGFALTEVPQVLMVLRGDMSLVGNRPLPVNVVRSLEERYADVEDRFITPAGMTGPVQLVGRTELSDRERLTLEATYCRLARDAYSWKLDLALLAYTVLIALRIVDPFSPADVHWLMHRCAGKDKVPAFRPSGVLADKDAR